MDVSDISYVEWRSDHGFDVRKFMSLKRTKLQAMFFSFYPKAHYSFNFGGPLLGNCAHDNSETRCEY